MSDEDWYEKVLRELDGDARADDVDESEKAVEDDRPEETVEEDDRPGEIDLEGAFEWDDADRDEPHEDDGRERADEPDETERRDEAVEPDDDSGDPFGGVRESSGDDPFGTGPGGDEEFGFGPTPGGDDEFGFGPVAEGEPPSDGPEQFDEEEFDSAIDRIDIGIEGLDEMILGGVPKRSLMAVIGGAGTGKTTFGLQFLEESLRNGERAVFLSLEQSREAVITTAEEKGWSFETYAEEGRLAVVSLDPVEMANSLASLRNDLGRLIEQFGADRVVLDSVSLLEMMYDHPAKRRSEVFGFTRSLKEAGVTTLLISEASEETPYASRYGIVEYLTDAVFVLQYVRTAEFRETRLAIEIQKIRDANHSRETKPFEITDDGINVYRRASIF